MFLLYLSLMPSDDDFTLKLYSRLNKRLLAYAYHLSRDVHWSRDAVQQVFLIVLGRVQSLTQMDDDGQAAYCFTILKNLFFRQLKQRGREESVDFQEDDLEDAASDGVDVAVFRKLEYDAVKAAVRQLNERHRMIIALRFGQNRTHAEIAEEMGISVSSSQNLQAAAIRRLKKLLGGDEIL